MDDINKINTQFYKKIEQDFDKTRQTPWQGWFFLKKYITKDANILDLACGNGRFLNFLNQNLTYYQNLSYTGVDNNKFLLEKAKQINTNINTYFFQNDLIQFLEQQKNSKKQNFDIILLFGIIHHFDLNSVKKILDLSFSILKTNGFVILSLWQFDTKKAKHINSNKYILDWKNKNIPRICFLYKKQDILNILKDFTLVHSFYADGKNNKSNIYLVLKKH